MSSAGTIQDMINKVRQLASLRKKEGFGVVAPRHKTNRNFNKDAVKTLSASEKAILRKSVAHELKMDQMKKFAVFVILLCSLALGLYILWQWITSIR